MPATYGMNLSKLWGRERRSGAVRMKAYTTHMEESEAFVSYQPSDQHTALELAKDLDQRGRRVFIDIHDDTLVLGQKDLDDALVGLPTETWSNWTVSLVECEREESRP